MLGFRGTDAINKNLSVSWDSRTWDSGTGDRRCQEGMGLGVSS